MTSNDEYFNKSLKPVLAQIASELLKAKPEKPVQFLIDLLSRKLGTQDEMSEKDELILLRQEVAALKTKKQEAEAKSARSAAKNDAGSAKFSANNAAESAMPIEDNDDAAGGLFD